MIVKIVGILFLDVSNVILNYGFVVGQRSDVRIGCLGSYRFIGPDL
jgi:hypothetical protein